MSYYFIVRESRSNLERWGEQQESFRWYEFFTKEDYGNSYADAYQAATDYIIQTQQEFDEEGEQSLVMYLMEGAPEDLDYASEVIGHFIMGEEEREMEEGRRLLELVLFEEEVGLR